MKLDAFLSEDLMQKIALENNLSETAFVVPKGDHFQLRWFTPMVEIDFCGHATVATAHVLATEYNLSPPFIFEAKVGRLTVDVKDGLYVLDAPIYPHTEIEVNDAIKQAFPVPLEAAFLAADNLYVVFENARDLRAINPDMNLVKTLSEHGVGITVKGDDDYDCVSRLFFPAIDLDEDPVTGSAHAAIGPYWAQRLGKTKLKAYQTSARGGILWLNVGKERLTISGHAVTYMQGEMRL